jgi:signal transduction histidine kinase
LIEPKIQAFINDRRICVSGTIKLRLSAFIIAIAVMIGLIAWAAQSAWRRGGELRQELNSVQLQSFQIADHVQRTIVELNNLVLRYGAYRDAEDWSRFATNSKALDNWIDEKRAILKTEKERQVLDQINASFDFYVEAAQGIEAQVRSNRTATVPLSEFAGFERRSQEILQLGFQLADAHRESMDSFLEESNRALSYLRLLVVGSLALLLLAGGGLAIVVYGELIAPLRVKLVQNQALIDRQEKLASLGMLAAGVAHEIRNPLTAIKAWLFIQRKQLEPGSAEDADAEVIGNELNRLERIVKEVLLFARPSEPCLAVVSAGEPLRQVQSLLASELAKSNIHLVCEAPGSARVRIDVQQILQVLINLIQNAADSIGQHGSVILRARTEVKRLGDRPTDVVVMEVADNGKGITPEVERRLFDPFFTTKESGTGLGLSIAARIVEKHGGALQYQTEVERGTTFGIVLPRVLE